MPWRWRCRPRLRGESVSLAPHDPALAAYLRGESFRSAGEAGWVLLCVDGYPLGWATRRGNFEKSLSTRAQMGVK